MVTHCTNTTG